jgi:hypothetical protein
MKLESKPAPVAPSGVCPVCKRPIGSHHTTVSVHGMTFHAYCAGYKRRAAA